VKLAPALLVSSTPSSIAKSAAFVEARWLKTG
jgi:hypothetical protein